MARLSVISPMLSKKPAANAYAGYGNPEPLSQYVSVSFFIMNLCMMMSFDKKHKFIYWDLCLRVCFTLEHTCMQCMHTVLFSWGLYLKQCEEGQTGPHEQFLLTGSQIFAPSLKEMVTVRK